MRVNASSELYHHRVVSCVKKESIKKRNCIKRITIALTITITYAPYEI